MNKNGKALMWKKNNTYGKDRTKRNSIQMQRNINYKWKVREYPDWIDQVLQLLTHHRQPSIILISNIAFTAPSYNYHACYMYLINLKLWRHKWGRPYHPCTRILCLCSQVRSRQNQNVLSERQYLPLLLEYTKLFSHFGMAKCNYEIVFCFITRKITAVRNCLFVRSSYSLVPFFGMNVDPDMSNVPWVSSFDLRYVLTGPYRLDL